ncbi:MAG TPA: hypothetical protein VN934_03605 [Candidatus Tumulicola sp.]|nr:hypothetical protein [Candidatus Tumulicola sp.]
MEPADTDVSKDQPPKEVANVWVPFRYEFLLEGFRRGSELLMDAVNDGSADASVIVYPLGYLSRHRLELMMKVALGTGRLLGHEVPDDLFRSHSLARLWAETKNVVAAYCSEEESGADEADPIIQRMHEFDPDSQHFRYVRTNRGDPTLAGIPKIDLTQLSEDAKRAEEVLTGITDYLRTALHEKRRTQVTSSGDLV